MKRTRQQQSQQQSTISKQQQITPDLIADMSVITRVNERIQNKCPDIRVELLLEQEERPYKLLLVMRKEEEIVSAIQMTVSGGSITISSDTYKMEHRQKKYNSVLRSVVILLASSMKDRSRPIGHIYSDAINWKTVRTLFQRGFTPRQVLTNQFQSIQNSPQMIRTLGNTQKLKGLMSGDQHNDDKPWLFVRMELDLITGFNKTATQQHLSRSISTMVC